MAALSPPSATLKPPAEKPGHLPTMRAAVAGGHSPSVALPLRFILTGISFLRERVGKAATLRERRNP